MPQLLLLLLPRNIDIKDTLVRSSTAGVKRKPEPLPSRLPLSSMVAKLAVPQGDLVMAVPLKL